MKTLRLLLAGSMLLIAIGCASSQPASPAHPQLSTAAADTNAVSTLTAIRAEATPSPRLVLSVDGSPAYTSYKTQPDVFVVDLPRTVKGNGVQLPSNLPPFVASISADEAIEVGQNVTRLTVRFTQPMKAQASGVPEGLAIEFDGPVSVADAAPSDASEAPVIETETIPVIAAETLAARDVPETGAAVQPAVSRHEPRPVSKNRATRLNRIVPSDDNGLEVRIEGNGAIEYTVMKLANPLRLVFDLKGLRNEVRQGVFKVDDPNVARIRVSQFEGNPNPITRVVFDMKEPVDYQALREGSMLTVRFGQQEEQVPAAVKVVESRPEREPARTSGKSAAAVQAAPPVRRDEIPQTTLAQVDPLPAETAPAKVFEPVTHQVVNAPAPQATTTDVFAEPVVQPPPPQTTELSGGIAPGESRALSSDERVYTGEPISLHLKDADIKDVLRTFASLTGLNIAIDPQVSGTVTVDFENVPWDQALELILRQNGLAYDLEGNVMRIGTLDRLAAEQKATAARAEEKRLSVPTTSVARRLSYAKAEEVQSIVQSLASPRGKIIVDSRTNQMVLTDIPEALRLMLNLIDTIDIPTPQVVIEARIVETTKTFKQQFGFRLGFTGDLDPALGTGTGLAFPNRVRVVGGPFDLSQGNPVLQLTLGNVLGTFDLDLFLAAAESEGLARIISAPRIATQDNQAAEIQSGIQIPFQTRVNFTTTVSFVDATLRLTVTPQITAEDTVIMTVSVQKVEPAVALNVAGGQNIPLITRRAQTKLMVRDGGTAVIGGIYQATDNSAQDRVPFLHEIPVLGNLFKNRNIDQRHDELLIFITPRIVRSSS